MKVFWIAVTAALLISFGIDLAHALHGGAVDLRNRITGVRLLEHGVNAYTYKWHYGEPDIFCDVYNNPQLPVSKTTATPALLLLHALLAALPYRTAEFTWLFMQWLALLATGGLWWRVCASTRSRMLLAFFLVGFTYTAAWRLHAERGQAYVVIALFFAAWLALTLDRKWVWHGAVGFLAGVLIALRPTFVLLVPFLILHRRAQLWGMAMGLMLGVAGPMLVHSTCWSQYVAAMQTNSELYRNEIDPRPGPQRYPAEIEGTSTDLLSQLAAIPYADFSAFAFLKYLGVSHHWLGDEAVPAWPLLLAVTTGFAIWLYMTARMEAKSLLAGLAAWIFLADFFLPAYRNSYNDVLVIDVVAAALALAAAGKIPWPVYVGALALPVGLMVYVLVPEQFTSDENLMQVVTALINLPTALFTVAAVWCVVDSTRSPTNRNPLVNPVNPV